MKECFINSTLRSTSKPGLFARDAQVVQLFGLESEEGLRPASGRELLAALLKGLQDCHWSR